MPVGETAYSSKRQDKYFVLEDRSWWFKHRIKIFLMIGKHFFDKNKLICDIGGSNGYNTKKFQDRGYDVKLIEPTKQACENAYKRGVKNICNKSFQDYRESIHQFLLLDVIEHIKDDRGFLRDIYDRVEDEGIGIISVPAYNALWSSEDVVDGHFCRYKKKTLKKILIDSGFQILYINYCFSFLWLPIYLFRHLKEKLPFIKKVYERTEYEEAKVTNEQFLEPRGIIGFLLKISMFLELKKIRAGQRIPFGSSLFCVVKKQQGGI